MVEAITLGAVVGFALATFVGLLTIAGCYYIGLSRLVVTFTWAAVMWAGTSYPVFAQSLFSVPREVTGKIVCSNCHLSSRDVTFSAPALCISGKIVEGVIRIPVLLTNAALQSDGSVGKLQLGGLVLLDESAGDVSASVELSQWSQVDSLGRYVFGPIDSYTGTGVVISWRAPKAWSGMSKTFYVAANRGRGQIYPDGSLSNLAGWKVPTAVSAYGLSISTVVCYQPKRYGSVVSLTTTRGTYLLRATTGQPVLRSLSLKTNVPAEANIGAYINLGGFGQTEQTLSFQQPTQVDTFVGYLLCLH